MGKAERIDADIILPTDEEEEAINRGIANDPDTSEADAKWFREAKRPEDIPELAEILRRHAKLGRPPLPEAERKKRVTLHLDPDVIERLKADGKGWQTRANAALRKALGI